MSIKHKLTLMMMGIGLAAVLMTVAAITTYLIYDMRKSKVQELEVTAAITADRNGAALVFLDSERANRNLEIFRLNPSIMAACVYDAQGALFAGYPESASSCPPQASQVQTVLPGMLTALREVRQNGERVGNVFMAADMRDIDSYIEKIILISGTVTLLVLAVVGFMTLYLQCTVSRPILKLAATAKAITEKRDYTLEADASEADETGVLARAFNEMLGEVRLRDHELRQANETLEQKVVKRTHQLEEAKSRAEAASEAKSEFLRNMSHEFRTPLHALISFSSFGLKEYAAAERAQLKQYFECIQKGAERLCTLVDEVLDLAKLERGEHRFLLKRGDLRELATRAADILKPLLAEKNITLRFDHAQASEAVCDHDKIVQVITNLLGNAIKFTPAGRQITLRTEVAEGVAGVAVIDEGIGIPEDERESIFESFRQSSRTNTGAGGTGLGLAICRSIVEAHGGRIWAQNNDGAGARVTFSIPAALEEGKRIITRQIMEAHHANAA